MFKSKQFKVLVGAVAVILGVIIITIVSGGAAVIANVLGFVTTPMQKVSATATDNVMEFLDLDSLTKEELEQLIDELSKENREQRAQLVDYYDKIKENEQLKEQLKVTEEEPELSYVGASVTLRDPNDPFYGFYIDKGSLAGVTVDAPVITEDGLVGIVKEVYATTSIVRTLFSEEVKVSASSKEFDEAGVIASNILMASNGTLQMNFLPTDTKMTAGTIITTSGAGGTFPANLVIGYVESIESAEQNVTKTAIIKPYADIKNVKDVLVIIGFPGKGEAVPEADYDGDPTPQEDGEQLEGEE